MAQKTLWVTSTNGDQRMVSVVDTMTVKEILQQFQTDDVQDRQATLLRGTTLLKPDMTVTKAGLEDGDELSLVWSEIPFVEMTWRTGGCMGTDLYVRIPPGTRSISDGAFRNCKDLIKLVIADSVTRIGHGAFADCSYLRQVEIPTQVEIPNSVTSIGKFAFANCSDLTQVKINQSMTRIGDRAFDGCSCLILDIASASQ